jgi:hypothetical protein
VPPLSKKSWSEARYDRRFWAWAYGALALFALVVTLLDRGARSWFFSFAAVLTFAALYKAWRWSREGRWVSRSRVTASATKLDNAAKRRRGARNEACGVVALIDLELGAASWPVDRPWWCPPKPV